VDSDRIDPMGAVCAASMDPTGTDVSPGSQLDRLPCARMGAVNGRVGVDMEARWRL
jgi:hypothetical protein